MRKAVIIGIIAIPFAIPIMAIFAFIGPFLTAKSIATAYAG